jgi:hypothetical protein
MAPVPPPGRGLLRFARGGVLAGFCLLLSLTAHVAGGGAPHLSSGLLVAGALLAVVCVAAADRQRGLGGIVAVLAVSQVLFHLLSAGGEHGAAVSGTVSGTVSPSIAMVAAHALAAAVVGLLLAQGERLVWSLVALCGVLRAILLVRLTLVGPPGTPPVPAPERATVRQGVCPRSGPVWRGPPVPSI